MRRRQVAGAMPARVPEGRPLVHAGQPIVRWHYVQTCWLGPAAGDCCRGSAAARRLCGACGGKAARDGSRSGNAARRLCPSGRGDRAYSRGCSRDAAARSRRGAAGRALKGDCCGAPAGGLFGKEAIDTRGVVALSLSLLRPAPIVSLNGRQLKLRHAWFQHCMLGMHW